MLYDNAKQSLEKFLEEFDELLDRLKTEEPNTENYKAKHNRGDPYEVRFYKVAANNKKEIFCEDQLSRLSKLFLETLEDTGIPSSLQNSINEQRLHRVLYHHSRMGISKFYTELGPQLLQRALILLACSAVSVAIFATVSFLGLVILMPLATALFAASVAYVGGLSYGISNDLLATRANLAYFVLGHQPDQRSFFISNDPVVQAIAWGVIATQDLAQIAALVFGVAVFITATVSTAPIATFVLPLLFVALPCAVLAADLFAQYRVRQYMERDVSLERLIDGYQMAGHELMSYRKKDQANWLANSDRNLAGYIGAPLLAIGALVAMLTISEAAVPIVLFSPLLSTIIPVIASAIVILALVIALRYALANQDRQIDNKYKLNKESTNGDYSDGGNPEPDKLYLDQEQQEAAKRLVTSNGIFVAPRADNLPASNDEILIAPNKILN